MWTDGLVLVLRLSKISLRWLVSFELFAGVDGGPWVLMELKVRDLTGFACLYRFGLSRPGLGNRTSQKLHGRKTFSSSVYLFC
jgi:hypothetical protein